MEDERIISPELEDVQEERIENSLRPKTLEEYVQRLLPMAEEKNNEKSIIKSNINSKNPHCHK